MPEPSQTRQLEMMQRMVNLSGDRTRFAAERTYMAAERNLSVWVRTALGLMALGIAIDRFGLSLLRAPGEVPHQPDLLSAWGGIVLIALAVVMVVTTGLRFLAYVADYRRNYEVPARHGPFLAPFFALSVALFGLALLVVLLRFTPLLH